MDFKNVDTGMIATELGMKDIIILELGARIKSLEATIATLKADAPLANGKVDEPVEIVKP